MRTRQPRYCGCYQLLYHCISWCEEILETIDFLSGSHTSTRELGREFVESAQRLVKTKINELTRTSEGRPIMFITKETVITANRSYQHTKESSITLFSTEEIEQIVAERVLKASPVKELLLKLKADRWAPNVERIRSFWLRCICLSKECEGESLRKERLDNDSLSLFE